MKKGFKEFIAEANALITTYQPADALTMLSDPSVVFVDVRDAPELLASGRIPGAVHASRGMLEFLIDPESPYHNEVFAARHRFVFYCASGGRSALASRLALEMGLEEVGHIGGGFRAWQEAGGPVETASE